MRKKRRMLTMGLAVFMIVSVLCTNVVHATGIESSPTDLTAENYIEETVSGEVGNVEEPVDSDGENMEESASLEEPDNTDFFEEESVIEAEGILQENSEDAVTEEIITVDETLTEQTEEIMFDTESMWNTENFQIQHKIVNYWDEAYQGEIIISNLGETTIEDWNLMFEMDVEITQIWNASINSCENNRYIIANNDWNANINAGQSVSFGYIATYEQHIVFPECYGLTGAEEELTVEEYEITYEIVDLWEDGYVANLTITNLALTELRNWKISFDLNDTICDLWNGKIHNNEDGNYIIHCADYNTVIKPGESVTIGFRVQDNELEMYPENYAVKVIVHSTMRTDMRDDVIGIAYFEDLKAEDYRIESDGIQYVANQLNLVGKDGVTFEQIAQLGEEYEFEIVGYIELTNDYQVKFVEDKTYEELNMLIEELGQNELVLEVEFNLVSVIEENYEIGSNIKLPNDENWLEEWDGKIDGLNWGVEAINALGAWQYEEYMTTVKVGVHDSVFDEDHKDLKFKETWNNEVPGTQNWADHGTAVAGIIAATHNDKGIAGVVINKELYGYAYRPEKDYISNHIYTTTMEYKYSFALMIGNGVRVINISQTTGDYIGYAAQHNVPAACNYINRNATVIDNFLQRMLSRGYDFVIVVAAGNGNDKFFVQDNSEYGYRRVSKDFPGAEGGDVLAEYSHYLSAAVKTKSRIIVVGAYKKEDAENYQYTQLSCVGERVDIVAPGEKIYTTQKGNNYMGNQQGTSLAAPYVSGVAALAYSVNPSLSGVQVKDIIVRCHNEIMVKDDLGFERYSVDAQNVVEQALIMKGNSPVLGINTGYIMGRVTDAVDAKVMDEVKVSAYCISTYDGNIELPGDYQYSTLTDTYGEFSLELNPGVYRVMFYYPGYEPLVFENIEVKANKVNYLEEVMLVVGIEESIDIKGMVVNALNGSVENDVEVNIRCGWNCYAGDTIMDSVYTDINGEYIVRLPIGYYTIEVEKEGYIKSYSNIVVYSYAPIYKTVICPKLQENEMRVVLTWGSSPRDLDSHLLLEDNDGNVSHIYYSNKVYYDEYNNKKYTLDIDDTTQYGPETVTFYTDNPHIDEYKYYIYNYSGGYKGDELSYSGARVTVYYGSQDPQVFYVPFAQTGRTWNVFSVIDGNIVVENTIS